MLSLPGFDPRVLHYKQPYLIADKGKHGSSGSTCTVIKGFKNDLFDEFELCGKSGEQYAIKRMNKTEKGKACFKREVGHLQSLKGTKSVLQLVDYYSCRGVDNIVISPWCPYSLENILRKQLPTSFTFEDTMRWMIQIADAIVDVHAKNIKHGDLKPGNILISGENIYISDFGYADFKDTSSSGTAPGWTPWYRAPEYHTNKQSDVWSMGVTFMEMIIVSTGGKRRTILQRSTRKNPNQPKSLADFTRIPFTRVLKNVTDPVRLKNLRTLLSGMLDKNKHTRFTAVEVAEKLRQLDTVQSQGSSESSSLLTTGLEKVELSERTASRRRSRTSRGADMETGNNPSIESSSKRAKLSDNGGNGRLVDHQAMAAEFFTVMTTYENEPTKLAAAMQEIQEKYSKLAPQK